MAALLRFVELIDCIARGVADIVTMAL